MKQLRFRTFQLLEQGDSNDKVSQRVDLFIILLVALNVLAVIIETMPAISASYSSYFHWFEIISVCLFSVE